MKFLACYSRFAASALLLSALVASAGELRTWTDATGQFTVEASMERLEGDRVILRRQSDDRLLELPLVRLSQADCNYVQTVRPDNPFLLPDEKFAASKSMVIVRLRMPTGDKVLTGLVVQRVDDRALVACRWLQMPSNEFDKYVISVHWRDGADLRNVPAQLVAPYGVIAQPPIFLVSAPADDLPPPLVLRQPNIAIPQAVKLLGFEFPEQAPEKVVRRLADGMLSADHANGQGFQIDENAAIHDALVLLPDGEPVGCFLSAWRHPEGRRNPATAMHLSALTTALNPTIVRAAVAPLEGDRKSITYGVVAYVADPLRQLRNPRLLLRFEEPWKHELPRLTPRPANGVWTAIPDAAAVELDPAIAPETLGPTAPAARLFAGTTVLGGRFSRANPGPIPRHECAVQVGYKNAAGVETFLPPQLAVYDVTSAPKVPNIPGLDMRPLDMARPIRVEGGWQITDDATRVDEDGNKPLDSPPFPDPVPGGNTEITACEAFNGTVGGRFACYSPDGAWLFILDNATTLRKYDATTMKEVAHVDLSAPCWDMTFSKAGLVVAACRIDRVWVLDPDKLTRRQEINVPGLGLVAGAPGSDIGVANGTQLHVVNFRTGKKIHSLSKYQQPPKIDDTTVWPIHEPFYSLRMTADGKHLLAFDKGLKRFRLEGENLIYEAKSKDLVPHGTVDHSMELSSDGSLVMVVPGWVFKRDKLETPYMATFESKAVAIDPVNGHLYSFGREGLLVLNERGSKIESIQSKHHSMNLLVVHPQGDRIVGWSINSKFAYFDLRKEPR